MTKKKVAKRRYNGEGSLYEDKKTGKIRAQVTIGYDPTTGKPIRKSKTANTYEEAIDFLRQISATSYAESEYVAEKTATGQWLDTYMTVYKKVELKPRSYESYYGVIERYIRPSIGHIMLTKLTHKHVQNLINTMTHKGLAPSTVHYTYSVLHGALDHAKHLELLHRNVADGIKLPKKKRAERPCLSPEQMIQFLTYCWDNPSYFPFLFLLATGLRRGELLGLRYQDVDFVGKTFAVNQTVQRVKDFDAKSHEPSSNIVIDTPKSDMSLRKIPLADFLVEGLTKYRSFKEEERKYLEQFGWKFEDHDLIFCSNRGTPMEPRNFSRSYYKLRKKLQIENVPLHSLRHTFATSLAQADIPVKTIQELLGHSDVSTTLAYYLHSNTKEKIDAMNLFDQYIKQQKRD